MFAPTAALLLVMSQYLFYIRTGLEGAFDPVFTRLAFILCIFLMTWLFTVGIIGATAISFFSRNRPIVRSAPSIFNFSGQRKLGTDEEFGPLKSHEIMKRIETYGEE
jgi:hypothetical protein